MKEYLKQYLLPKEMGGQNYTCVLCGKEFVVRKDSASGNRQTLSICRKCVTELGRIEKYGSVENFKKACHENLSNACKEKWENEEYRNNMTKKVKEAWSEDRKTQVAQKVKESWSVEKEVRRENISLGVKNSLEKKNIERDNFKKELKQQTGEDFFTLTEAMEVFESSDGFLLKTANRLGIIPIKKFNCTFYSESQLKKVLEEKGSTGVSFQEKELSEFVKSIYPGPVLENDRKTLNGKELDVYLPEKNLALEFNGLYWHSDVANVKELPTSEEKYFAKCRHLEKTKLCEEKGIRLIHVFEDDWTFQKEKIKALLSNILLPGKVIFARKCEVKNLSTTEYKKFLEEFHLQGYSPADLKLGLFYNGELVECIGIKTKGTHVKEPELVRLCTRAGYRVVGGFSKLLKHSNQTTLVSYIDRGTFDGKGYYKVGFRKILENEPTYFYCKNGVREPRYNFTRKNIQKKFEKGILSYFNPNETEEVNMYKNGYGRIWNCGTIKVAILKEESKE